MMYDSGMPVRKIAEIEGVPAGSVNGIASRYLQQISGQDLERSGRPQKITDQDKRRLIQCIEAKPIISNRELLERTEINVSITTITSYLKSQGIQHKVAIQRPLLTP